MNQSVTVPLSAPLKAHGETLSSLTLRPPTGRDLNAAGYPISVGKNGATAIDAASISKMISQLAEIPPSSVDAMSVPDWNACLVEVMRFIKGESPATS